MIRKWFFLFLIPLFLSSCTKNEKGSGKDIIFVTIAPYAYLVEKIAGDTLQVETLIPPGVNLHIFEPTPKQIQKQSQAKIWLRIDEPFEKKIVKAISERNPTQKIINLQEGLPLLGPHDAIELGACTGHDHGSYDLHTWLSPILFLKQARLIADTLIAQYPEHQKLYQNRFDKLALELDNLQKDIQTLLAPSSGEAILVSHPAFAYFARDFSLKQISIECEGKEPKPRDLEEILARAKQYQVRCVFLQEGFDNRGAMQMGKKLQLPIYRIDPYAKDYPQNMRQIAKQIAQ